MIKKEQVRQVTKIINTIDNLVLTETERIKCKNSACPHYAEYTMANHCKKYQTSVDMVVNCQAVMPWRLDEIVDYLGRKDD